MLRLNLIHAEPGMVVAADVRHPRHPGIVLLRPGAVLDNPAIAHMRDLRLGEIWIRYPALEHVAQMVSPAIRSASREVAMRIGRAMDSLVSDRHARLDYASFRSSVTHMLDSLSESPTA